MKREMEQAKTFCADYFGTSQVAFEGVSLVDALAGYLARVKAEMLSEVRSGDALVSEQLDLFEQQGVLF